MSGPRTLPERAFRQRARLVAVLFCAVAAGLAFRLFWLQLRASDRYTQRALGQQLRDTIVPADRGRIYSADGVLLAANSSCWTLRASPREMPEEKLSLAAQGLAKILELDEAALLEKFSQRRSNDCLLRYRVDRSMADQVRDFCEENNITGIRINQDSRRWYPQGEFLASVLGFTNVDNAGVSGLELEYDDLLTGENGVVLTAVNAWGYTLEQSYETERFPTEGDGLRLTIDTNIQHYLENALGYAVREHHVAARAVGIVMDVNTGAVLAMSTTPSYDPNQPRVLADKAARSMVDALPGDERKAALQLAQQTQWRNKAVSDLYEPGSVFKLITCAAALDAGAISKSSSFYCGESISVAGTRFHCANHKRHGAQTVTQALENSCNQSFIQIGARLGKEAFCDYFAAFGLREPTGIDLPAEPKKSLYYTADRMGPVELASCAFGQSSKISYLEMASAVCAVVNGGKLLEPYLVSEVIDKDGNTVLKQEPTVVRQTVSPETSETMRTLIHSVVTEGTAKNANVVGYSVGGKTGTSEKIDVFDENGQRVLDKIVSFVGIAPMEDPEYIVLAALDTPSRSTGIYISGGVMAAPTVGAILADILPYLGVRQNYTEEDLPGRQIILPDLTGYTAQEAEKCLKESGFSARCEGDGETVAGQIPAAGQSLPGGSQVLLYLGRPPETRSVKVPDFLGKSKQQAADLAGALGLYILPTGNPESGAEIRAIAQDIPPGTQVAVGTTIPIRFADQTAKD